MLKQGLKLLLLAALTLSSYQPPAYAQTPTATPTPTPTPTIQAAMPTAQQVEPEITGTAQELNDAFELSLHVLRHKSLYALLNETFAENVSMVNTRGNGLTLTQIIFLLMNLKSTWPTLNDYLEHVPKDEEDAPKLEAIREHFRHIFSDLVAKDQKSFQDLIAQNDPTQALVLNLEGKSLGYTDMQMFVNHPLQEDPDDKNSGTLPGSDLRQLVIDFIGGAKEQIYSNIFDFDLKPISNALLAAADRGVETSAALDKNTYDARQEVKNAFDPLLAAKIGVLVDPVGLNHQKIIVRDPFGPNAAVLFLSGNFTQSCLGPEGDAIDIPETERPRESIPNSNHAVVVKGTLPALVAAFELRKITEHQLRGQSGFPPSGAFKILGGLDTVRNAPSWMIMAFSPNGGLGNVNRDVLSRLFRGTTGPIEALTFAISSKDTQKEIIDHLTLEIQRRKAAGKSLKGLIRWLGDPPMTLMSWSVPLALSGMVRNAVSKLYSAIPAAPFANLLARAEYKDFINNIRVANRVYGSHLPKQLPNGKTVTLSAKIHDKVFILPENHIAMVGTSFNPSENAETNNEQILIVRDSAITLLARQMLAYHFFRAQGSVRQVALRKNRYITNAKTDDCAQLLQADLSKFERAGNL